MTTDAVTPIKPRGPISTFTLPASPGDAARIASALSAAGQFMVDCGLHADAIKCSPGPYWERDAAVPHTVGTASFTLPGLPRIAIDLHWQPDTFYHWCEALNIERITVERDDHRTYLRAEIRAHGFTWLLSGDLIRPAKPHPHLPGIPVPWVRENGRLTNWGRITRDELRTVLARLGVLAGAEVDR